MNKIKLLIIIISVTFAIPKIAQAQKYAASTNSLAWLGGSANAAIDFKVNQNTSIDLPLYINPVHTKNVSLVSFLTQPAVKLWLYNTYTAHYISMGLSAGYFNLANKQNTYKGYTAGVGFGYGYTWAISKQINIGAEIGIGFNYLDYADRKKNVHYTEDEFIHHRKQVAVLPYRCGVNLIYLF